MCWQPLPLKPSPHIVPNGDNSWIVTAKLRTGEPMKDPACVKDFKWATVEMHPGDSFSNCGGSFCKDN